MYIFCSPIESAVKDLRRTWKFLVRQNSLKNAITDTIHNRIVRTNYRHRMFRSKNSPKKEKLVTEDDYAVQKFLIKPNATPANDSAFVDDDMESDSNVTSEEDSELEINSDSDNDYSETESNYDDDE